ncbi:MAG: Hint domain-containing protein [Pseudomonadota bacterium]
MTTPSIAASVPAATQIRDKNSGFGPAYVPQPDRNHRPMRRFQISYLRSDGTSDFREQIGPALPKFEAAFSAFSRGTLINTPRGRMAIEDLEPGMEVSTKDGEPLPVMWIGSMTLIPHAPGIDPRSCRMTRVMPEAFGLGRPEANLMAGPGARIMSRPEGLRDSMSGDQMLTPARDLADGLNVIEISPQHPVSVYHLCLPRHSVITAAGLEMETFHPGNGFDRNMGQNALSLFMSMFPHLARPTEFGSLRYMRLPTDLF